MKKFLRSFLSFNPVSITAVLIILVIILFILGIPIFDLIELKTFDLRFKWRGSRNPSPALVAAVIDEKSLDKEGRWPWPRNKLAELINKLSDDGAKVIGFDIFFTEPDENSSLVFLDKLDKEIKSLNIQDLDYTKGNLRRKIYNEISNLSFQAERNLEFLLIKKFMHFFFNYL